MKFKLGSRLSKKQDTNDWIKTNVPRGMRGLTWLVFVLLLAACRTENSLDEFTTTAIPTITIISPTPKIIISSATPSPAPVENRDEEFFMLLVEAKVRETDGYSESDIIKIEHSPSTIHLPELDLYIARPLVLDSLDSHCAVYGEEVWCFEEALRNIVSQFALGSDPEQLNDAEWLAMISFFTYTTPLVSSDDLALINRYIPATDQAKINAPMLNRLERGGIDITYYFETVDYMFYPDGEMTLSVIDITVTDKNEIFLEHREIWNNFDSE